MWMLLLLLNGLALNVAVSASAEDGVHQSAGAPSVSTTITARKMTVRNQDGRAVFEGSVVLTKGSLIVYSDKMIVLFHPDSEAAKAPPIAAPSGQEVAKTSATAKRSETAPSVSNRSVNRIEAMGHVKIEKENGKATCQKAVYFSDSEKIILTGDPVAWEKGTRVSGQQITMYLAEDRSVVEGGSHVRIEGEEKRNP
jgi:lipopolysaccharide export system protein LptA